MVDDITSKTDQNYSIDINQIYNKWISRIDEIRSFASVELSQTLEEIMRNNGAQKGDTAGHITIKIEDTPQESRCHAFYRWIGFPVATIDTIYSPGFDIYKCSNKHLDDVKKTNIAKVPLAGFNKISVERERYFKDCLNMFAVPQSIESGTLALSSGGTGELRDLDSLKDVTGPFDFNIEHQKYKVGKVGRIGESFVSLTKYIDGNGNKIIESASTIGVSKNISLLGSRKHIIAPFLVDPRIDYAVTPQSKLIAVPFLPTNSHLKASSTESVRTPLIEDYIRDRLLIKKTSDAGTDITKVIDYIKMIPSITDNQLVKMIQRTDGIYKDSDVDQFIDTINLIKELMRKLVESENDIAEAQSNFYFLPEPSDIGPENGGKVRVSPIPRSEEDEKILLTNKDRAIITAINKTKTDNQSVEPDPNSSFHGKNIFSSKVSDALGDNNAESLETSMQIRDRVLAKANNGLRTIEIIMGEFSGLGLCDIAAIIGALRIIPIENLLGLMDDDANVRMANQMLSIIGVVEIVNIPKNTYPDSLDALTTLIKEFYKITASIYKQTKDEHKQS